MKKDICKKSAKPSDSSWWIWIVATVIMLGIFSAQFVWGGQFTTTIITVYTPIWGVITVLYMLGRVARQKITTDSLVKIAEKVGGDVGGTIASIIAHTDDKERE